MNKHFLIFIVFCLEFAPSFSSLPPSFANTISSVLYLKGGALRLDVDSNAMLSIEQQLKRVASMPPDQDLDLVQVRALPDEEILRILTLAVVGNLTSRDTSGWQQTCSVVVDPQTGALEIHRGDEGNNVALRVLLVGLIVLHLYRWMMTTTSVQPDKKE